MKALTGIEWICCEVYIVNSFRWLSLSRSKFSGSTVLFNSNAFFKKTDSSPLEYFYCNDEILSWFPASQTAVEQRKVSYLNLRRKFIPVWGSTVYIPVLIFYEDRFSFSLVIFLQFVWFLENFYKCRKFNVDTSTTQPYHIREWRLLSVRHLPILYRYLSCSHI